MPTKVVTDEVRFSYANVFKPTAFAEGDEPKYNISLLIPKKSKKTIAAINAAIEEEKAKLMETLGVKVLPKTANVAELRDGDEEYPGDEIMEGMYFIRASSKLQPGIVDETRQPILTQEEFYSGCYGRASINVYAFGSKEKPYKGVAIGLNNVQKLRDGDALGAGRSNPNDDFGDDDDLG